MNDEHRISISESRTGKRDKKFNEAMRKAGYTQDGLARAAKISPALLSRARSGDRSIREAKAKRIEALIGWPADDAHWPRGVVSTED